MHQRHSMRIATQSGNSLMQQLTGQITYQDWDLEKAKELASEFADRTGGVMIALHKIQETFGYVDDTAMAMLGKVFNLSRAEVHGVTSFYHDFRRHKPGKYTVKVCQAEACQAMGSDKLTEEIKTSSAPIFTALLKTAIFHWKRFIALATVPVHRIS